MLSAFTRDMYRAVAKLYTLQYYNVMCPGFRD
jgi:hypothetical protein